MFANDAIILNFTENAISETGAKHTIFILLSIQACYKKWLHSQMLPTKFK